ncbi:hypothetical protein M406DRAFT_344837 [Cryphonectria parasitica EP155]|uniref:Uncharacterized protein n=1 Tax=Cryphonectria parasitica (strain ATCC 38755 / EP155) TaxID=660469 RepID=A0A9P4YA66_CRYP1|nr:uncharacterized protein M406DRAFT_344837 [Cryphonectria parasitica EP155]KAF3768870.1 hypothetical protein M406DRAFT_344837 [Cryphonectria parasitica EP155]
MAPPPSQKPGGGGSGGGARSHKRAKVHDARTIRAQPADAALRDGELDLQAFLSAREFEIRALTSGMSASKHINNRRAFQLVPRAMRRRTASHNAKKLPKRLRARARREQVEDNTPTVETRRRKPKTSRGRIRAEVARRLGVLAEKKRQRKLREARKRAGEDGEGEDSGKGMEVEVEVEESAAIRQLIETRPARPKVRRNLLNEPPRPKARFRKRQIDKTWLPTHLWHAKRAKMTPPKDPLWRFAIPLTPNEKVYRPTHRASTARGAMVWDMSYMSTIGLYGHEAGIQRILGALGMSHGSLWDDRGKKWRDGRRKWSGMLSKEKGDIRRPVGPATVIWDPEPVTVQNAEDSSQPAKKLERQVFIRLHPSCFLEVFNILTKLIKRETPRLYVEDLRFEVGSIELTGPGATEALLGVIHPYHEGPEKREDHARLFGSLLATANDAALPSDVVLGFSAQDPRLRHPPRTVQARTADTTQPDDSDRTSSAGSPSPYLLFDRNARFRASCFPSQKALNRRRGTNPPGHPLQVSKADPPFPVILLSSRLKTSTQSTWTLLAPWKCILPLWHSLVHYPLSTGGNPRVGGLDELRQVTFEQGLPWFPGDFPGTEAGAAWELEQRQKRNADWERRPKSKRVAWESLDLGAGRKGEIGIGWACEFESLFGLRQEPESDQGHTATENTDKSHEKEADDAGKAEPVKTHEILPHPLTLVHHLSKTTFNTLLSTKSPETQPPKYSIASVKITFPGRGVVNPCARIYRLPSRKAAVQQPQSTTQPEIPATHPLPQTKELPTGLRNQWLAKLPGSNTKRPAAPGNNNKEKKTANQPTRFPTDADHHTQKLLLVQSLVANKVPFPPPAMHMASCDNNDPHHPLIPGEEDLIGYVTKGEFSLSEGKGVAIGAVSVEKALESLLMAGGSREEGRVCVVRNAGEVTGWVGRWEAV